MGCRTRKLLVAGAARVARRPSVGGSAPRSPTPDPAGAHGSGRTTLWKGRAIGVRSTHGRPGAPRRSAHRAHPALAPARRRARPVRRVPARLQAARRPAGGVLRPGPRRRPGRAHHLRALERLLRRPHREEAAEPLPARAPRCSRFGTAGCNLACRFCQNWDISKSKEIDRLADAAPPEASPAPRSTSGCAQRGVHLQRPRGLPRVRGRRGRGLPRAGRPVGGGHRRLRLRRAPPRALRRRGRRQRRPEGLHRGLLPPRRHGRPRRRCSTRSSYLVHETDVWLEITTLLIPGHNDGDDELDAHDRAGSPSTWAPRCRCTSAPSTPTTGCATCRPPRRRRSPGPAASPWATACATSTPATCTTARATPPRARRAATAVIERDWYDLKGWHLTGDGHCRTCGAAVAGVFDGPPGEWGRRRLPVQLAERRSDGRRRERRRTSRATAARWPGPSTPTTPAPWPPWWTPTSPTRPRPAPSRRR